MKQYLITKLERFMVSLHKKGLTNLYVLMQVHAKGKYRSLPMNKKWKVWRRDEFRCVYCGLNEGLLTIDHIVPRAAGGTDRYNNLCACCMKCNNMKGSRSVEEFINSSWLRNRRKKIQKKHSSTMNKKPSITSPLENGLQSTSNTTGENFLCTTIELEAISGA